MEKLEQTVEAQLQQAVRWIAEAEMEIGTSNLRLPAVERALACAKRHMKHAQGLIAEKGAAV